MNPLVLPETESGIARVLFDIQRIDLTTVEASGRNGGVQAGWPLWSAVLELERSDPDSGDMWITFRDRLRGAQRSFIAWDTSRPYPKAYPVGFAGMNKAGGGAFTGAATAWSQTIDADGNAMLALTGLPANFVISRRDGIGFKWDAAGATAGSYGRRTLARVQAPVTASALGAATVMIEPPLDPLVVPAGAIAHFDKPACVVKLVTDKSELGPIGAGGALGGGRFTALQDLRP